MSTHFQNIADIERLVIEKDESRGGGTARPEARGKIAFFPSNSGP